RRRRGRHHGLRAGRARRRRLRRAAGGGRHARAGAGVRRGGVQQNGLRSVRPGGRTGDRREPGPARRARARERRSLWRGLDDPPRGCPAGRGRRAPRRRWLPRREFATAYTPYQPEVSQGTLQATFEFQTLAALLLGLEVANASMYDGASATAEAVLMARRLLPGRRVIWLARALHPHYRATVATYLRGLGDLEVRELPFAADGRTDLEASRAGLGADTLCLVLGYPNVFGMVEDVALFADAVHAVGGLVITA